MLTQAQQNIVFTNIETAYTVGGVNYTAFKEYKERWSGIIDTPVIMLEYVSQGRLKQGAIGRRAEWDTDRLALDVFAVTDVSNNIFGETIVHGIAHDLSVWFKGAAAHAALNAEGLSIGEVSKVIPLSFLEEKVYRKHFEVDLLYKLI